MSSVVTLSFRLANEDFNLLNISHEADVFRYGRTDGYAVVEDIPTVEIFTALIVVIITVISKGVVVADGEGIASPPVAVLPAIEIHDHAFAHIGHAIALRGGRTARFEHGLKAGVRRVVVAVLLERSGFKSLIHTRHRGVFIAWNEFVRCVIGAQRFLVHIAKVETIDR